jgi:DNA-binding IclR family transcriptional regulator
MIERLTYNSVMQNKRQKSEASQEVSYPIGSVDNALKILLMLRHKYVLRVSEISRELGVARSTAHRLLAMLRHHGFIHQDAMTKVYVAGSALLELSAAAVGSPDLRALARPHLGRLRDETEETVHLVTLQGSNVMFIEGAESSHPLRVGLHVGTLAPAHVISAGKALLAELSVQHLATIYPKQELAGVTKHSITRKAVLDRELREIRKQGYAIVKSEYEVGVVAVGVVIKDKWGRVQAGLALAAPSNRVSESRLDFLIERAKVTAEGIGKGLN